MIMALEMQDLMALQSLDKSQMTPYEQYKVGYLQAKKPSGVAIAGLTVGVVGAVAGVTAWIFSPIYANARAKNAQDVATAQNAGTSALLNQLSALLATERAERVSGDITLNQTITDTVSGSQSGQLSASQIATNEASAQILAGVMTGKYSESPQKVELLTPAQPFQCGCGCNG